MEGRDEPVPGGVTFVLGLAAPEPVLVMLAGEVDAVGVDVALAADSAGCTLTSLSRLRSLGRRGEEQVCQPRAGTRIHPIVIAVDPIDPELDCGHVPTPGECA
jgi:hypothetical protein